MTDKTSQVIDQVFGNTTADLRAMLDAEIARREQAESALSASQAEVERLTRERDEANHHDEEESGEIVARVMWQCESALKERDAAIARERALRECLETVFAQHGDPNGEDPGCMMTRATYERIDDLLHNPAITAPSPACPSCERMARVVESYRSSDHTKEIEERNRRIIAARLERDRIREALDDAASSLEALSRAGSRDDADGLLSDLIRVRGYAENRAKVARAALSAPSPACPSCERMRDVLRRVLANLYYNAMPEDLRSEVAALAHAEGTHETKEGK